MELIAHSNGFEVWFNVNAQLYSVWKDGKFVIGGKTRFIDVQAYVN